MSGHSYHSLNYHVVFSTKRRLPLLTDEKWVQLRSCLREKSREIGAQIHHANGTEDHVHLLLSCAPRLSMADCLKHLKGYTSRRIDELYWQNGYYAFTVDRQGFDRVYRYIANQKAHHAKQSWQDEMKHLLATFSLPKYSLPTRCHGFKPVATNRV
ncbi:MAG: hypothetical protein LDLANPLL_00029 [Turneriella sp.]|nr:hypothetical protein [Turneriella sp.]